MIVGGIPMMFGGAAAGVSDPYFSMVKLLVHAEGANGSTTFTDSSTSPQASTAVGGAQISTARAAFGNSSILLDGTGDNVTFPNSGRFDVGTSSWAIEGWGYAAAALNALRWLFSTRSQPGGVGTTNGIALYSSSTAKLTMVVWAADVTNIATSTTNIPTGSWFHWAGTFDGTTYRVFINGTLSGSVARTLYAKNSDGLCWIGSSSGEDGSRDWPGNKDEVRFTIGNARYTANFTPPIAPHPDS